MNTLPPCPHCHERRPSSLHFTDAGAATPDEAAASGYCRVLAELRNR